MSLKPLFITGIGTGVGKTVVSSVVVEKLNADYWKPIQSGDLDQSDTLKVQSLISNSNTIFHQERFRLTEPLSPHLSAKIDGIEIKLTDFILPRTKKQLVIEGAGGLMVPLNHKDLIIDLIAHLNAEVILVSQHYLGSINHTLLSIELLKSKGVTIKGIIFNGDNPSSEEYIVNYSGIKKIGTIKELPHLNKENIRLAAEGLSFLQC